MAEKGFGVKEINLIGASGTPTIESPNNLNLNAVNVAISTNATIGGNLTVTGTVGIAGTLTYEDVTNVDAIGIITARSGINVSGGNVNVASGYVGKDSTGNRIVFHANNETRIFHSSNDTVKLTLYGSSTTLRGSIEAQPSQIQIKDSGGRSGLVVVHGAESKLYYNDNQKIATTNTGATITGTLAATAVTGDGSGLTGIAVTEAPVTDYTITGDGSNYYFHGGGVDETAGDPDLYLIRGQKYRFNNTTGSGHPFLIRVSNGGSLYTDGVTGDDEGVQFFTVPYSAPASLVYQCEIHGGMVGNIYIRGGSSTANISNNSNDRIITGGSGGNLNGEANLTFDGSTLAVTGEITPSSHINLASGKKLSMASDVFKIYHSTNAAIINESGDLMINQNVSNKDIKISTGSGPTESVRITSGGSMKVGFINNTNPTTVFDVMASAINQDIVRFTGANYNRGLKISTAVSGSINDALIKYDADSQNSAGQHAFLTDGTERVRIDSSGRIIQNYAALPSLPSNLPYAYFAPVKQAYGGVDLTMNLHDDESNALGNGGGIGFSANNSSGDPIVRAAIRGNVEATNSNAGYLTLHTRPASGYNTERLRITSVGNIVFKDKDSGHTGGGFYSRTKTCSGNSTTSFMRFVLSHGALAGAVYATASNNARSIAKSYTYAVQYGDGSGVNLQSDSGDMGGTNFSVDCSTSANQHDFRVTVTGSTAIEVNLTVVVGCANQDITYTEL